MNPFDKNVTAERTEMLSSKILPSLATCIATGESFLVIALSGIHVRTLYSGSKNDVLNCLSAMIELALNNGWSEEEITKCVTKTISYVKLTSEANQS